MEPGQRIHRPSAALATAIRALHQSAGFTKEQASYASRARPQPKCEGNARGVLFRRGGRSSHAGRVPRPTPSSPHRGGRLQRLLSPKSASWAKISKVSSTRSRRSAGRRDASAASACSAHPRRTSRSCCRVTSQSRRILPRSPGPIVSLECTGTIVVCPHRSRMK